MSDLSIKVSDFEGPLDLLIHLIEKDKIDIYDIPIVSVTEQYIAYLKAMSEFDMEAASEFLVMAATLLQIKSRMLLPKEAVQQDEEETDPRKLLVEMLVEYRKIKRCAAELLKMKLDADRVLYRKPLFADNIQRVIAEANPVDLLRALSDVISTQDTQTAFIEPQAFSVQDKMNDIMCMLADKTEGFLLNDIFKTGSRGEKVAAFLGVLELLKLGVISITQSVQFAPIYIFAKQGVREDVL